MCKQSVLLVVVIAVLPLPNDAAAEENSAASSRNETNKWRERLDAWSDEIIGERERRGRASEALRKRISRVQDPAALPVLKALLGREANHHLRVLYVQAAANIDGRDALELLVDCSVKDESEYVRKTAAEAVGTRDDRAQMRDKYLRYLRSERYCDQAAGALLDGQMIEPVGDQQLPDPKLYSALVQSLVKVKRSVIGVGRGSGGTALGGRFSSTRTYYVGEVTLRRDRVLAALRQLTGEDYGFEPIAYSDWYRTRGRRLGRIHKELVVEFLPMSRR